MFVVDDGVVVVVWLIVKLLISSPKSSVFPLHCVGHRHLFIIIWLVVKTLLSLLLLSTGWFLSWCHWHLADWQVVVVIVVWLMWPTKTGCCCEHWVIIFTALVVVGRVCHCLLLLVHFAILVAVQPNQMHARTCYAHETYFLWKVNTVYGLVVHSIGCASQSIDCDSP